ncbi:MAG: carbamate kinase [Candidatus Heimdallarchaeota archaeon]
MMRQEKSAETIVIALGGNALVQAHEKGTMKEQFRNVNETCRQILDIIKKGHRVVITHGNGPQVGNLLIQQEEGSNIIPPQPLDIVGAMTQGQIGYMLQQTLITYLKEARLDVPVATIVTQVLVNENDPDFRDPSKPVGPFYNQQEAEKLQKKKGYIIKKVKPSGKKQYRRVVPSPDPISIIEKDVLRRMVEAGVVVIAAGGGGIPVIKRENGSLEGIEAVIDKDLAGERLTEIVGANIFLILTDISKVKLDYGKPDEKDLDELFLAEAEIYLKEGHFLTGSMKPKIQACIRFLKWGGKKAIIGSITQATEALEGRAGTLIYRG